MIVCRLITKDDTSQFCHSITEALSKGWSLHGSPSYAFDAANGAKRCAQALTKETDLEYSGVMKLGQAK